MGPYLIQLWRVCYVWKIVLSGWLFQILIVQFRLYLQPPWIVIVKTYTFTTGSKRVANSLSCERQGNVAVMNGSLGSEWFSATMWRCHHVLNLRASFCKIDHRTFWNYTDVQTVAQHLVMSGWSTLMRSRICSLMDLRITVHSSQRVESFEEKKRRTLQTWCQKNLQTLPKEQLAGKLTWCEPPGRPSGESFTRQRTKSQPPKHWTSWDRDYGSPGKFDFRHA